MLQAARALTHGVWLLTDCQWSCMPSHPQCYSATGIISACREGKGEEASSLPYILLGLVTFITRLTRSNVSLGVLTHCSLQSADASPPGSVGFLAKL